MGDSSLHMVWLYLLDVLKKANHGSDCGEWEGGRADHRGPGNCCELGELFHILIVVAPCVFDKVHWTVFQKR